MGTREREISQDRLSTQIDRDTMINMEGGYLAGLMYLAVLTAAAGTPDNKHPKPA